MRGRTMCLSRAPLFPEVSWEQICKYTGFADRETSKLGQPVRVKKRGHVRHQVVTMGFAWSRTQGVSPCSSLPQVPTSQLEHLPIPSGWSLGMVGGDRPALHHAGPEDVCWASFVHGRMQCKGSSSPVAPNLTPGSGGQEA